MTVLTDPFIAARFFSNVDQSSGRDGCWVWTGMENSNGYGRFSYRDNHVLSHRFAYSMFFGEIPSGMMVCHSCDNRKCVNPKHLWLGTQAENLRDAVNKGRMYVPDSRAHRNGNKKLSWPKVKTIREMGGRGVKKSDIAQLFGVSPSTIGEVIKHKIWKEESNAQ